jgi:hypothetical protein
MNTDCLIQYASIAKDTVITLAAAVGAYVALRGLSTWNRQLKGGVEYDLTKAVRQWYGLLLPIGIRVPD